MIVILALVMVVCSRTRPEKAQRVRLIAGPPQLQRNCFENVFPNCINNLLINSAYVRQCVGNRRFSSRENAGALEFHTLYVGCNTVSIDTRDLR